MPQGSSETRLPGESGQLHSSLVPISHSLWGLTQAADLPELQLPDLHSGHKDIAFSISWIVVDSGEICGGKVLWKL